MRSTDRRAQTATRLERIRARKEKPKTEAGSGRSPAKALTDLRRAAEIKVNTWANIKIDGREVARNATGHRLGLRPGKHLLEVSNPFAFTHRQEIDVPAEGTVPLITVQLRRKPAQLKVFCNVPDADIAIRVPNSSGGENLRLLGSARKSIERPLRVPLAGGATKRKYEIIVHKKGYVPQKFLRTFEPGDLVTLRVVLQPFSQANAEGKSRSGNR